MKAQALGDAQKQSYMKGKKTLEINPRHPIMKEMLAKVAADEADEATSQAAKLMYTTALLESGFAPDDTKSFAMDLEKLVRASLGVSADAEVDPEPEEAEEEPEEAAPAEEEGEEEDAPVREEL